ncbi:CLUMA_CG004545, isoform A [Clunio marinus]|uniref:CLUMA_CG004545, isoform A n=1 Tax=Clunio marinus TaxID=568069 RepID=A0A1J1HS25_9DIPT|nr:CLUMA_CG004545, isoform A [Clunio marinus]
MYTQNNPNSLLSLFADVLVSLSFDSLNPFLSATSDKDSHLKNFRVMRKTFSHIEQSRGMFHRKKTFVGFEHNNKHLKCSETFLFVSVRLGVIITSSMVILQELGVFTYYFINEPEDFEEIAKNIQQKDDDTASNPTEVRLVGLGFSGLLIVASIMNIIASLKIWKWLSIPFIILQFIRLITLLGYHIMLMMILKKQLNLGVLIVACCAGGFLILFLGYLWACSLAFFEIVGIVNSKEYQSLVLPSSSTPATAKIQRNFNVKKTSNIKPFNNNIKNERVVSMGMFLNDFSEFNKRPRFAY